MLAKLFSPAVRATVVFAVAGVAFAIANLLLARSMTTEQFGQFSLVLAIAIMWIPLGPLGLDSVVLRARPGPQPSLLGLALATSAIGAAFVFLIAVLAYDIEFEYLLTLPVIVVAGGVCRLAASIYQSVKEYKWSLWLVQGQNLSLFIAALLSVSFVSISAFDVLAMFGAHWVIAAVLGWIALFRSSGIKVLENWSVPWKEVPALFGYVLSFNLMTQLDRLLIPKLLDINALATFGVLSPLVLAPFKMLQSGVGYTLIPRMRVASDLAERRGILIHEAITLSLIVAGASIVVYFVAPWVADVFLEGKYTLPPILILSAIVAGIARVVSMYASAIVTAVGSTEHLAMINRGAWFALACSVLGGWIGSRWGLAGFIFGYTSGIFVRAAIAGHAAKAVMPLNFERGDSPSTPSS